MQILNFNPIPREFYTRYDVVLIARELLGKVMYTLINNELSAGMIVETEAYAGITDRASHAYNNRRTLRTEIMYREGGHSYVYLCYGIHSLFNIVTSVQSDPQAVLIRGIYPVKGLNIMNKRTGKETLKPENGIGPGNVSKLLGIQVAHTGSDLCGYSDLKTNIWLQDEGVIVNDEEIKTGTRIGIEYAKEDALLPYRFRWIKTNKAPF